MNQMKAITTTLFGVFALVLLVLSCDSKSKVAAEIEKIPITVEIHRFDKDFANASVEDLPQLKNTYPQFFPEQYPDSLWEFKLRDTLQQQLNEAVLGQFPDKTTLEDGLHSLFQHITYYFPEFETPKVFTTTSDVDYKTRVIATDSILIIELDNYLGSSHPFYEGISKYISKNLKESQVFPDVAAVYAHKFIPPPNDRSLLAQMVYYGKELYLKDLWLPNVTDSEKIGYTPEELQWAKDNEVEIWQYFIENELLFITNPKLPLRFIVPAPFSKFNLSIDNDSPGMIGRWMGWQMVRSYMDKNQVSVSQLLSKSADEIYKNANYKPKK